MAYKEQWTLDKIKNIIKDKGIICLSTDFKRIDLNMEWKCDNGHYFTRTFRSLKSHSFACSLCKKAAKQEKYLSILRDIAKERGGSVISESYKTSRIKLKFKCINNHEFEAIPSHIVHSHQWCKECNINVYEEICRVHFETLFNKSFPNVRPDWLKNLKTGKNLELDGYCEELKLAFEHQGEQHFNHEIYNNTAAYNNQKERDQMKKNLCDKLNITMIEIPELEKNLKIRLLRDFIKIELLKVRPELIQSNFDLIPIDTNKIYFKDNDKIRSIAHMKRLHKLADENGGWCLSTECFNQETPVTMKCKFGHEWETEAHSIFRKTWCPRCVGTQPWTMLDVRRLTNVLEGKPLFNELKFKEDQRWECNNGHLFDLKFKNILNSQWCSKCSEVRDRKYEIVDLLLFKTNMSRVSRLALRWPYLGIPEIFNCPVGHNFETTPINILRGANCPECVKIEMSAKTITEASSAELTSVISN